MLTVKKAIIASAVAGLAALFLPASAAADAGSDPSGSDPCKQSVIMICSLVPVMPGLDHDVDLTTDPNGQDNQP